MNLIYAMGGGLGHLARVRTLIEQWALPDPCVFTANPLARQLFPGKQLHVVPVDVAHQATINRTALNAILPKAQALYLDAFPAGLLGELTNLPDLPIHYLARRLKLNNYHHDWPTLDTTYVFEPLEAEHTALVHQQSKQVVPAVYSPPASQLDRVRGILPKQPFWLVLHAFHTEEVEQLVDRALMDAEMTDQPPHILVVSDQAIMVPKDCTLLQHFPARDFFPFADRIYTGCGFNSIYETADVAHKHIALPFHRKLDDQQWRFRHVYQARMQRSEKGQV